VSWLLLMIIDRVILPISHVWTIFNIISILKTINYIQSIKFPKHVLNFQSPSWISKVPLKLPKHVLDFQNTS
jgi:hypothetical protein